MITKKLFNRRNYQLIKGGMFALRINAGTLMDIKAVFKRSFWCFISFPAQFEIIINRLSESSTK